MMIGGEREVAREILKALSSSRKIKRHLTLLVDSLHSLTGERCSVFLVAPREGLVCWEYSRGGKEGAGSPARQTPYHLDAAGSWREEGWRDGSGGMKLCRALDEEVSVILRMRPGGSVDDYGVLRDIVEEVLPAVVEAYRGEKQEKVRQEARAAEQMGRIMRDLGERRRALRLLAAAVCKSVDAERATVLHYSEDEGLLRVIAAYGRMKDPTAVPRPIRLGQGVAGWCLLNRKPAILTDARSDPRYLEGHYDDIRSMLCVPVLEGSKPMGALCAVNRLRLHGGPEIGFKRADQDFVEALGQSAIPLFRGRA